MVSTSEEKYIEFCAPQRNSRGKENIIRNFLVPFFGANKQVSALKLVDYESFYSNQLQSVAPSTANRRLATLKNMITKAVDWSLTSEDSLKTIRKIKLFSEKERWRLRYLTQAEARELLNSCEGALLAIVTTALHTGMRRGEIFDLLWEDVRFDVGFIYVRRSKGAEQRQIPITEELIQILTNLNEKSTG